jgi:AAA ATPase domain
MTVLKNRALDRVSSEGFWAGVRARVARLARAEDTISVQMRIEAQRVHDELHACAERIASTEQFWIGVARKAAVLDRAATTRRGLVLSPLREGPAVGLVRNVELLEREHEQAALAALVVAACQGAGRVGVVEGPAGIGKTRLLIAARAEAERAGMRVLTARGMELEREFAYGVTRQLFEPVLAGVSEAERAELFSGAAGQAAVLFDRPDPARMPVVGEDASFAVVHGLFWLAANLCAQGPVMLCVDDVHWSDAPSLRFLAYLLPRLEGLRLVVLVGLQAPAEPGADPDHHRSAGAAGASGAAEPDRLSTVGACSAGPPC